MRLKSRRKDVVRVGLAAEGPSPGQGPVGVPVVDGEPVEPYELPQNPHGTRRELNRMVLEDMRRRESERTRFPRGARAVADAIRRRKGRGFEVTLFRRYTLELHGRSADGGERFRLEFYRSHHWDLNIEFWRSL